MFPFNIRGVGCAHLCIVLYQIHSRHKETIHITPVTITSTNELIGDVYGDIPIVSIDSMKPSKLKVIMNFPDLIPFKVFLATYVDSMELEEATISFVISSLILFSSTNPRVFVSMGNIRKPWMLCTMSSFCNTSDRLCRANLLEEYVVYPYMQTWPTWDDIKEMEVGSQFLLLFMEGSAYLMK